MTITGLENILKKCLSLKGKRVGLIASATSVDSGLNSAVRLFHDHPDINLTTIFGAQQGFWGETQDNMVEWKSGTYPENGLPLYSLYGEVRKPTKEMLSNIDVLVCDLQDIGTRVYTFIWTMALAMQACAEFKKEFVVLDRPNPITGSETEGNVSAAECASFVALYPLPLRHGMTSGEIATYINEEYKIGCDLTVVQMKKWKRKMWFDETGLPWVIPSANLPTVDTATVYPGTVIFEGTNISEGRGTTRPFEIIGAPFIDGFLLQKELDSLRLDGVRFRPCKFIPTFQKHAGKVCGGIQIHVTDRDKFKPVKTAVALLKKIIDLYPHGFEWKAPPYEYVTDRIPIDVICGKSWIRESLTGGESFKSITEGIDEENSAFSKIREKYLMY